jgi:hypothetical protein
MISSESSDEELEALHLRPVAAPARLKAKRPKRERPTDASASTEASSASPDVSGEPTEPKEPTEEEDEEARRIKRELRKQRKLEERQKRVEDKLQAEREQRASERASRGRAYTVTMAIPGSILDNAQTKELKTYVAGQVARAAVIFQVDEVVVFDDQLGANDSNATSSAAVRARDCHVFMARILQYLETPQYLRRALFPMHSDLSCAGLLNPLDCPHHLRGHEWSAYREGVVVDRPLKDKEGSHVHVGLQREVVVDKRLTPGVRVTVKIDEASKDFKKKCASLFLSLSLSLCSLEGSDRRILTVLWLVLRSGGHARVVGRAAGADGSLLGLHGAYGAVAAQRVGGLPVPRRLRPQDRHIRAGVRVGGRRRLLVAQVPSRARRVRRRGWH